MDVHSTHMLMYDKVYRKDAAEQLHELLDASPQSESSNDALAQLDNPA